MGNLPSAIGPYRIIRQLGEGGMGAVFEAVHEIIQRRVAIKVLLPEVGRSVETINRFLNEARATNLVDHPGLVQVTDFGNLPDGSGYLVMEYLQGETLAARLVGSGTLSASETVQIGTQIAAAVAAAHKKGIIHRDLKPNNIMLVPDSGMPTGERVKILDFGLVKLSAVPEAAHVKTNSTAIMGTAPYMSPEQCEGAGRIDAKTDVYALGCILYEMLSGQPPFMADGIGPILAKHLYKEPEPLRRQVPSVPGPLAALVHRLLVKSKERRPSMREAQREMESLAAALPPPPRRQEAAASGASDQTNTASQAITSTLGHGSAEQAASRPRRGATKFLVAGALTLLILLGGFLMRRQKADSRAGQPTSASVAHPTVVAQPQPANPMKTAPIGTPPPSERRIHWSIATVPPGAELVDAQGVRLGTTPLQLAPPTGRGTQTVRLRSEGYVDKMLTLKLDVDEERTEKLEPIPAPALQKTPADAPAATKSKPPHRVKKDLYIHD